jgi:integrase
MPRKTVIPSLRRHRPSGLGVVTLNGKDLYLGAWPAGEPGPPAAVRERYDRAVAEWLARGRRPPAGGDGAPAGPGDDGAVTVAEVLARFLAHADAYYRRDDGSATSEVSEFVYSLRPLNHLYGELEAAAFGPLRLKAVRGLMASGYDHPRHGPQAPLCRSLVNKRVRRVVHAFRWAASEELVPESTWRALASVGGLRKGRCQARESEPVGPVAVGVVEATLPFLNPHLQALVRLQLLTGCRPGEACGLRLAEVDRGGPAWLYRPRRHKNAHRGKERVIALGPRAREVLLEFVPVRCPLCGARGRPPRLGSRDGALCGPCAGRADEAGLHGPWPRRECADPEAHLFGPRQAREERFEDLRARRKSKVPPGQLCRRKPAPKKGPGDRYGPVSYAQAIGDACRKAGVPAWHAHQLRHTHATLVRSRFGLEAAQAALGHARANVTELYAERDLALAARVAAELG